MHTEDLSEIIHVRVPADLVRELEEAARRDDRTVSSWVRSHLKILVGYHEEEGVPA